MAKIITETSGDKYLVEVDGKQQLWTKEQVSEAQLEIPQNIQERIAVRERAQDISGGTGALAIEQAKKQLTEERNVREFAEQNTLSESAARETLKRFKRDPYSGEFQDLPIETKERMARITGRDYQPSQDIGRNTYLIGTDSPETESYLRRETVDEIREREPELYQVLLHKGIDAYNEAKATVARGGTARTEVTVEARYRIPEIENLSLLGGLGGVNTEALLKQKEQKAALSELGKQGYVDRGRYDLTTYLLDNNGDDTLLKKAGFTDKQINEVKDNTVSLITEEKKSTPPIPYSEFMARYLKEQNAPDVFFENRANLNDKEYTELKRLEPAWYRRIEDAYNAQYGQGAADKATAREIPEKIGFPVITRLIEPTKPPITASDIIWTSANTALIAWGVKSGIKGAFKGKATPVKTTVKTPSGVIDYGNIVELPPAISPEFTPGRLYTGGTLVDIGAGKVAYIKTIEGAGIGGTGKQFGMTYQRIFPKSQGYVEAELLKPGYKYFSDTEIYLDPNGTPVPKGQAVTKIKTWQAGTPTGEEITQIIQANPKALRQILAKEYPNLKIVPENQQLPPGELWGTGKTPQEFRGVIGEKQLKELLLKGRPLFATIEPRDPLSPASSVLTDIKIKPGTKITPALAAELRRMGMEIRRQGAGGVVGNAPKVQQYEIVSVDARGIPIIREVTTNVPFEWNTPGIKPSVRTITRAEQGEEPAIKPLQGVRSMPSPATTYDNTVKPSGSVSPESSIAPAPEVSPLPKPSPLTKPITKTTTRTDDVIEEPPPEKPVIEKAGGLKPFYLDKPKQSATEEEKQVFLSKVDGIVARQRGIPNGGPMILIDYYPYGPKDKMVVRSLPKGMKPVSGKGSLKESAVLIKGIPPQKALYRDTGAVDDIISAKGKDIVVTSVKDKNVKHRTAKPKEKIAVASIEKGKPVRAKKVYYSNILGIETDKDGWGHIKL